MAEPITPGPDWSVTCGTKELVTVNRTDRQTGAVTATATGIEADRGVTGGTTEPTTEGGGVPVDRLTWDVRSDQQAMLDIGGLRKGDQLLDAAGAVWVVLSTGKPKYGEPYEVQTVRLRQ